MNKIPTGPNMFLMGPLHDLVNARLAQIGQNRLWNKSGSGRFKHQVGPDGFGKGWLLGRLAKTELNPKVTKIYTHRTFFFGLSNLS